MKEYIDSGAQLIFASELINIKIEKCSTVNQKDFKYFIKHFLLIIIYLKYEYSQ